MDDTAPTPTRSNCAPAPAADDQASAGGLEWLVQGWIHALELRDWRGLESMINLDEVYLFGVPRALPDVIKQLESRLDEICDLEVVRQAVEEKALKNGTSRLSLDLRVIWSSTIDWEEDGMDLMVHAVFQHNRTSWIATQLTIERAMGSLPNEPVMAAPAPIDLPSPAPLETADSGADAVAEQEATKYFGEGPAIEQPYREPEKRVRSDRKRHVVYMPVMVDEETIKELFG
jgi:hypothetical protein